MNVPPPAPDTSSLQADIWSFGCTALESSTALPPWGKGAIDGMLSAVKRGSPPGGGGGGGGWAGVGVECGTINGIFMN